MSLRATPPYAKTVDELPKATGKETQRDVIVNTNEGVKRLEVDQLYASLQFLIGSYQYYSGEGYPSDYAVLLLGGKLNPEDFEDQLVTLKSRIPKSWIQSDGTIELPTFLDRVLQFDPSLSLAYQQEDAIENFFPKVKGTVTIFSYRMHDHSGVFSRQRGEETGIPLPQYGISSTYNYPINFSISSSVARTASHTRERTVNALLSLITGRVISNQFKNYTLRSANIQLRLPVGVDGDGIGYNSSYLEEV